MPLKIRNSAKDSSVTLIDGGGVGSPIVDIDVRKIRTVNVAGVAFDFYGVVAPFGALACIGQEVSKATYPELYAAIGDSWATTGGAVTPSAGNFRLPFQEHGGHGVYARGVGVNDVGVYEDDTYKEHKHAANHDHTAHTDSKGAHQHDGNSRPHATGTSATLIGGAWSGSSPAANCVSSAGAHTHAVTIDLKSMDTGNSGHTETRPKSITVLKCVWTGQ